METLIIIPTYNERNNITTLLHQLGAIVPQADIIVIDDNSPDGTADLVERFAAASPQNIKAIRREGMRGLGMAYKAGFTYGLSHGYELLITMDADMSHDPQFLPAMLSAAHNHDLVIGSRYIRDGKTENWELWRVYLSWGANTFARYVLGLHGKDLTSGFRIYHRHVLEKIDSDAILSNGYSFLVEMLYHAQLNRAKICEVPIVFVDRTQGVSKISKREIYRGAWMLIRLRLHLCCR